MRRQQRTITVALKKYRPIPADTLCCRSLNHQHLYLKQNVQYHTGLLTSLTQRRALHESYSTGLLVGRKVRLLQNPALETYLPKELFSILARLRWFVNLLIGIPDRI